MFAADFDTIAADWPQTLTVNGTTVSAVVHDVVKDGGEVQIAGVDDVLTLEAQIKLADFTTAPTIGDKATYNAVEYRIVRFLDSACGVVRTIYMEEVGG